MTTALRSEEGAAAAFLPEAAEELRPAQRDLASVLPLHH